MRSRAHLRSTFTILAAALIAALPLVSCKGGGGGGKDRTAPTVSAVPAGMVVTGANVAVTLLAVDNKDAAPLIYYTTDLSEPTTASTLYVGPITLTTTTILKFIAVDATGNTSSEELEGYTFAASALAQQWAASGHGDITAEPWRHWDGDTEVSTSCAKCHGEGGLKDYGEDGTVDNPGGLPLGLACSDCHTAPPNTLYDDLVTYPSMDPIAFPSADSVSLWGDSNLCMACHQGRSSAVQVDEAIAATPGGPYNFINIHYYAAAATFFGTETQGGYQFTGADYVGRNVFGSHPPELQTCVGCHMRGNNKDHHFMPEVADCTGCHAGASFETLGGSPADNYTAITTGHAELLAAIQAYATNTIGTSIAYNAGAYPYFFVDDNGNGVADANETTRYTFFDATLLKAAYNYQMVAKDPGGYIHNGVYIRQLIDDSITAVGGTPTSAAPGRTGFDLATANKTEQWRLSGHAHATSEAFRHWDGDPEVPTSCAKCHTSTGFADYAADGTVDNPVARGELVGCSACHDNLNLFGNTDTRYDNLVGNPALDPVTFPSGATQTLSNASNICMTCHQGRESGDTVANASPNTVMQAPTDYDSYDFINRHYFAAAAILFGTDVTAGYEYGGQTYVGKPAFAAHGTTKNTCIGCHGRGVADHTFQVQIADCNTCHAGIASFEDIKLPGANVDYDGDGTAESFDAEIKGQAANLYTAIQAYAAAGGAVGLPQAAHIIYVPGSYPYWFHDTDMNGMLSPGEDDFANRYRDFDDNLLRAAYNYHCAQDPCSDIHNHKYVLQTLYDSIDQLDDGMLNGSITGVRP
ncbi:MAG: chitobiase/beta-hexosaminidase C-terminal domain-containing protein [Planctomycetes bacterium]|nr:chitobiase/beta-hexosaminidase C-terminal domain-containing protein [Planctomycetota bacterium]